MTKICKRFIAKGLVQGVFFRDSTRKKALELSLTGWVKNRDDGAVELIACGDSDALNSLEAWLWQGPPAANVLIVESEESEWQEFKEFTITHSTQ